MGALANFLNTTSTATGANGGILTNGKLPQQFFVVNPQFGSVQLIGNNGNSTYNALQAHIHERLSHGITGQFSYTFSKTLGDNGYRDENNYALSKGLLSIDRTHVFQGNVLWLPCSQKAKLFSSAPEWTGHIVQGWQVSSGFSRVSGIPLSFNAGASDQSPEQAAVGASEYQHQLGVIRPDHDRNRQSHNHLQRSVRFLKAPGLARTQESQSDN